MDVDDELWSDPPRDREHRIERIEQEILDEHEEGRLDLDTWIARHPDLEEELRDFHEWLIALPRLDELEEAGAWRDEGGVARRALERFVSRSTDDPTGSESGIETMFAAASAQPFERDDDELLHVLVRGLGKSRRALVGRIVLALWELRRDPIVERLAMEELRGFADQLSIESPYPVLDKHIPRHQDEVRRMFTRILDTLPPGSSYDTLTTLRFWDPSTIGDVEEFLTANIAASRQRDIAIRRVMLIDRKTPLTPAQLGVLRLLDDATGLLETRVCLAEAGEIDTLGNFAICGAQIGDKLVAEMRYSGSFPEGGFRLLQVRTDPDRIWELRKRFHVAYDKSRALPDYLRRRGERASELEATGRDSASFGPPGKLERA